MAKDIFGFEDTRTEEEKKISEELSYWLSQYRSKYGMDIDLSGDDVDDKELIRSFKKCINENLRLSDLYPELVIVDYDYDY